MWFYFPAHDTLVYFTGRPYVVFADDDGGKVWQISATGVKTVLAKSLWPKDVLALPQYGLLLWGDKVEQKIFQRNFSGEGPKTEFMSDVRYPIALSYMEDMDLVLWVDYMEETLESCQLDGSGRKKIVKLRFSPIDLVIVDR